MKKLVLLLFIVHCQLSIVHSQNVGIGTTTPAASAQLEIKSTSRGLLPPRMSAAQRKAIASPAAGLIVFDTDAGQLYLFDGNAWVALAAASAGGNSQTPPQQEQPLTDQQLSGYYGFAVDLSDTYAVAGAHHNDSGSLVDAGAVYVYTKTSGVWRQTAKLMAPVPQANGLFGYSVATAANYIVVGEPGRTVNAHSGAGQVYVFVKGSGNTWTLSQTLAPPSGGMQGGEFGLSVALSNVISNRPALAISEGYYFTPGIVYAYQGNFGSFSYIQTIQAADLAVGDRFGFKISIDGDDMAISAPDQSNAYSRSGAVYIYTFGSGGGNSSWLLQQKLLGRSPGNGFGEAISLLNNRIAISTPYDSLYYKPYVYIMSRTGTTWSQTDAVFPPDQAGFDYQNTFGASLSLDSTSLLIGAPAVIGSSYYYNKPCYALLFKLNSAGIFYLSTVINDGEGAVPISAHTSFGFSVALRHGSYIIGAPAKTLNGVNFVGAVAFGFVQ